MTGPGAQPPLGVVPGEKFVTDLIAARTVSETASLASDAIHRATGQFVPLVLEKGDPREMKRVALSLVHWFRLHPEVPLRAFWVTPIPRRGDEQMQAYAYFDGTSAGVVLNADIFGAGRRRELRHGAVWGNASGQFRRSRELQTPVIVFHEMEHHRYRVYGGLPDLLPGDVDTPQVNRGKANTADALVAKITSYTKTVEDLTKRYPRIAHVNDHTVEAALGTYAKSNTPELFAEGSGHVHARGSEAPQVAQDVTAPLGSIEQIQAAAPGFLQALRDVDKAVGRDGLPKKPLLHRLQETLHRIGARFRHSATPKPEQENPWTKAAASPPPKAATESEAEPAPDSGTAPDSEPGPEPDAPSSPTTSAPSMAPRDSTRSILGIVGATHTGQGPEVPVRGPRKPRLGEPLRRPRPQKRDADAKVRATRSADSSEPARARGPSAVLPSRSA